MAGLLPFSLVSALAPVDASVPPFFQIFEHGELVPIFINNGVLKFSATGDSALSTAPLADGLVNTYNKVRQPMTLEFSMVMDGATVRRVSLLSQLMYLEDYRPTGTYDIVTPIYYYQNYAIKSHNWALNEDDQNVLVLNIIFQQILTATDLTALAQTEGLSPATWFTKQQGRVLAQAPIAAVTTFATRALM